METIVETDKNLTDSDTKEVKSISKTKKQPTKKKKVQDSNKPKRPSSTYILWLKESRAKIKAENPGISFSALAAKAGELWKTIKDRSEWEAKAFKLKEEYFEAMTKFKATDSLSGDATSSVETVSAAEVPVNAEIISTQQHTSTLGNNNLQKSYLKNQDLVKREERKKYTDQ